MSTCKSCRYFVVGKWAAISGYCHRRPPLVDNGGTYWPYVEFSDWCGEFEPPPDARADSHVVARTDAPAVEAVAPTAGRSINTTAMVMMLGLLAIIVLTWLSSAKAGTQEACPPELMSKMIEGRTIVIALARCENRPMSIADSKRLSDKIFGSVTEFQPGGSCATANFDALEQVLNEFHRNKDAFCNRARPLMRQHKL